MTDAQEDGQISDLARHTDYLYNQLVKSFAVPASFMEESRTSSESLRQQITEACAGYLDKIHKMQSSFMYGTRLERIVGHKVTKQGRIYFAHQIVYENGTPVTDENIKHVESRDRRFGPHRPRRKLMRYVRSQQDQMLVFFHPALPIEYITCTVQVNK